MLNLPNIITLLFFSAQSPGRAGDYYLGGYGFQKNFKIFENIMPRPKITPKLPFLVNFVELFFVGIGIFGGQVAHIVTRGQQCLSMEACLTHTRDFIIEKWGRGERVGGGG